MGHVTLPQALLPARLGAAHLPEHFGFQHFSFLCLVINDLNAQN